MLKGYSLFLFFIAAILLQQHPAYAQASQTNTPSFNYLHIPFATEKKKNVNVYIFEIAEGQYTNTQSFEKNIIICDTTHTNNSVVRLPFFNKTYTWRARYIKNGKALPSDTSLHNLITNYSKYADTNYYRWKILQPADGEHAGLFVFVDYLRSLFDMYGNAVWYLPNIAGIVDDNTLIRDLKCTNNNTITFLTYNGAYEVDYNGKVLWEAPNDGKVSGGAKENYHHEFTKMANGHYMLTGTETTQKYRAPGNTVNLQYETLIEYDKNKKIVWQWKASQHLPDSIVFSKRNVDGTQNTSMHLNSFYLDEKDKVMYLSFRDLGSIIAIAYPSGEILNIYNGLQNGVRLFKSQHSCRTGTTGSIYMYCNNNAGKHEKDDQNCISTVAVFQKQGNTLHKAWEFRCDIDNKALPCTNSGGNIIELKNGNWLVSMGSVNRNFIVSNGKKVLWNTLTEMKNGDNKWQPAGTYRISYINGVDPLKKLVLRTIE
jgi:hypothetical protein